MLIHCTVNFEHLYQILQGLNSVLSNFQAKLCTENLYLQHCRKTVLSRSGFLALVPDLQYCTHKKYCNTILHHYSLVSTLTSASLDIQDLRKNSSVIKFTSPCRLIGFQISEGLHEAFRIYCASSFLIKAHGQYFHIPALHVPGCRFSTRKFLGLSFGY